MMEREQRLKITFANMVCFENSLYEDQYLDDLTRWAAMTEISVILNSYPGAALIF